MVLIGGGPHAGSEASPAGTLAAGKWLRRVRAQKRRKTHNALVDGYPRRRPNPIVELIRWAWFVFVALAIVAGIGVLVGMIMAGWWWVGPIVILYVFCVVVLLRKRRSRFGGPS